MASPGINDAERAILQDLAQKQVALGPGVPGVDIFGYVSKPDNVTHDTMEELVRRGFVNDLLCTGYGEVMFYRLTDAGAARLSNG